MPGMMPGMMPGQPGFPPAQFIPRAQMPQMPVVSRPPATWSPPPGRMMQPSVPASAPASLPAPIARGRIDDEPEERPLPAPPPAAPLTIPSPADLGVGPSKTVAGDLDWNAVNRRLRDLKATSSQRQTLPQGGYRFVVLLPGADAGHQTRIEAEANTEAEAVRKALDRAEEELTARR
jgi:hypothetical protein